MTELLFLMSMSASVLILLCFLLFRLTENRLSARQQYTAMKFVLIFLLLPIGPCLNFFNVVLQEAAQIPSSEMMPVLPATSGLRLPDAVPGAVPTEAAALPQLSMRPSRSPPNISKRPEGGSHADFGPRRYAAARR